MAFAPACDRPPLPPLDGRPLIVHVVVNVESWPFDQPMPRKLLSAPHGAESVPDIPNYSWVEYGLRAGMPRLFALFADRSDPFNTHRSRLGTRFTAYNYPRNSSQINFADVLQQWFNR